MPIFQAVTYLHEETDSYDAVRYSRLNNTPNHYALHTKLADVCAAEAAMTTSSGMAAITTAMLGMLDSGDHMIAQKSLYGGTFSLVMRELPRFGIEVTLADAHEWDDALRDNTRILYLETISNPTMRVGPLLEGLKFAEEHGLKTLIDNTFASPVNARPAEMGFDLSIHSATKYLNGHSDVVAGVIAGSSEMIAALGQKLNLYGSTLDPHASWLLQRGMKTLALRVARQNASALALATWLEDRPEVSQVMYPGLASHPDHERACKLLDGFGGMLAFELEDADDGAAARLFCQSLSLAVEAPSLGGVETLVTRPATSSHKGLTAAERREAGISNGMIRVSVGIEAVEDLIHDFERALGRAQS